MARWHWYDCSFDQRWPGRRHMTVTCIALEHKHVGKITDRSFLLSGAA